MSLLASNDIQLVVVVDKGAVAEEALTALGADSTVPLLMGTNDTYWRYQVAGLPTNFLIDRNGDLVTKACVGWDGTLLGEWIELIGNVEGK